VTVAAIRTAIPDPSSVQTTTSENQWAARYTREVSIAHRGNGAAAVRKHQVDDHCDHVKRLVERTDVRIGEVVFATTGRTPW
jgi:hypothetical protein